MINIYIVQFKVIFGQYCVAITYGATFDMSTKYNRGYYFTRGIYIVSILIMTK